jgi:hypothetical protein
MNKSEKKLESDCCKIARAKGLAAVKLEKNGHKGIPDRLFIKQGGQSIFVEFKRPDGSGIVSPEQKVWAEFIGESHFFCSSVEEFQKILEKVFRL